VGVPFCVASPYFLVRDASRTAASGLDSRFSDSRRLDIAGLAKVSRMPLCRPNPASSVELASKLVISVSNRLKPWPAIRGRESAALAGLVEVLRAVQIALLSSARRTFLVDSETAKPAPGSELKDCTDPPRKSPSAWVNQCKCYTLGASRFLWLF